MTSAPPIGFEYRASRLLMLALLAVAALAIVAVYLSALPGFARIILTVLVAAVSGSSFGRLLRPRVRSVLWQADGSVYLHLNDMLHEPARESAAELAASQITGPLIILKLRWLQHGRATLWLLPDNLDADTRRRLRVRIRSR